MDRNRTIRPVLWRDSYVLAAAVLMVIVSVPLTLSVEKSALWTELYPYYFDAPLLVLTALALWSARRAAFDNLSRRFWGYLAAGFVFWILVRLFGPFLTLDTSAATLATDLLFLAFYLLLILAFQIKPHLRIPATGASPARQLEPTGATLFSFGLLIYFIVIPATYNPSELITNIPSAMLYVVLNFYLLIRAVALMRSSDQAPWRECYRWLVLAIGGFVILDGFDLASRIDGRIDEAVTGTLFEALWLLPMAGFVLGARCYVHSAAAARRTPAEAGSQESVWRWRGKLTYFALVLPLIHMTLEILGWSDDQTRPARQMLVVFWILFAAGLSVLYDRRLLVQQQLLEQRQQQVNQQFEVARRMDAVRRMAGGIAHDFNNLLMVIQGFAEALAARLDNDEDRGDAEQISRAAERAGSLTQKLLAMGRHEKVGARPFAVNDVLRDMEKTLQRQAEARLELDLSESVYVSGERGAFEDAILNLLLNASEAITHEGIIRIRTGRLTVDIGDVLADTLGAGTYGYTVVEDNGEGMDEVTQRHVFEPFFSKRTGGSGLGLSMVYSFARESGGTVTVESQPGQGSSFRIILPEVQPPEAAGQAQPVTKKTVQRSRTILLVEDEDSVRRVLSQSMQRAGIKVLEAVDGQDALRVLKASEGLVDMVITDVVMPNMDGGSLARELRKIDPGLPIIFITGHSAGQLDRLGGLAESTRILRKPFAAKELLMEIESRLNEAANER